MVVLHQLSDFLNFNSPLSPSPPNYYYQGLCPQTGALLRLPRTDLVEAIAHGLMNYLGENFQESKMYGVLLVELVTGEQRIIKAFSGLLNGSGTVEGWVPPIPGREQVALIEALTLTELESMKQELITLRELPIRQKYEILSRDFSQQLQIIGDRHHQEKQQRQEKRQQLHQTLTGTDLDMALLQLDNASRQQGIERRHLKRQQNEVLQPLKQEIAIADQKIRELRQKRKLLSQQLQTEMQAAYRLTNFYGQSQSLKQLIPTGSPTGTGDCCAPKLLHYAATHQLKPLAMAEFWWGESSGNQNKIPGKFYGACEERCQPLMGFLLSGLKHIPEDVELVYQDKWLIVVNKPAGLLSVPGRYGDRQDSVLSRLRYSLPDGLGLLSSHRLDQETSGLLILSRDRLTHSQLSWQFQKREIHKVYEALLSGIVTTNQGVIELPLWGNPENRPYQQVDYERGKPSSTRFRVMGNQGDYTRIEFLPLTGRTHQLRVHAVGGLGLTILGDRLYGCHQIMSRLYLHARELSFQHPHLKKTLSLKIKTPF